MLSVGGIFLILVVAASRARAYAIARSSAGVSLNPLLVPTITQPPRALLAPTRTISLTTSIPFPLPSGLSDFSDVDSGAHTLTLSSASDCGGSGITLQNVEVTYSRTSQSFDFITIGQIQLSNISPSLDLTLKAFDLDLSLPSIDLCDLNQFRCPFNDTSAAFNIRFFLKLDRPLERIVPPIFWHIPDLPAELEVRLREQRNYNTLACVMLELSNGISFRVPAVPWVSGALALSIIAFTAFGPLLGNAGGTSGHNFTQGQSQTTPGQHDHSNVYNNSMAPAHTPATPQAHANSAVSSHAHEPPAGRMDPTFLFLHFQSISSSGLLSLNYPPMYQAFTTNFAWANLIIPIRPFRNTAGRLARCHSADVGRSLVSQSSHLPSVLSGSTGEGIPAFARKVGVNQRELFGIAMLLFLCACGLLFAVYFIGLLGICIRRVSQSLEKDQLIWAERRQRWRGFASNNILRIMYVTFSSLATFAFNQWIQKCNPANVLVASVFALLVVMGTLGSVSAFLLHIARRPEGATKIFNAKSTYGRRWGTLYNTLREGKLFFVPFMLFVVLARSAITAFGQGHGLAQLCCMIVVDLGVVITLLVSRPYYSSGFNRVVQMLEYTKTLSHILMIPFVDTLHIPRIASDSIGLAVLVLQVIVTLMILVLTVIKFGWGKLWGKRRHVAFR